MTCTTCDLPAVVPIAQKTIEAHGLSDRITAAPVDIFSEPCPRRT